MASPASASSQVSSLYFTPSSTVGSDTQGTPVKKPTTVLSSAPTSTSPHATQNTFPTESTPVSKPSVKSRLGPRPVQPQPPKIPLDFFAGLSQSNSPEKRQEEEKAEEEECRDKDEESENESPPDFTSYDDGIHFEPLIPLPKKIEKKTGEEGEEVLFEKRAKLYRYVKDDKAWKERGHGTIKILSSEDSFKFRIVMRRDHTLKICANHFITADMDIKPGAGKGNSLVWTTHADYADEVPRVEQLAVRFKLPEEATDFKDVFESCKAKLSGAPENLQKGVSPKTTSWKCISCSKENQSSITVCATCGLPKFSNTKFPISNVDGPSTKTPGNAAASPSATQSLLTKFAPKPGTWECNQCLVNNQASALSCVACNNKNPSIKTPNTASPFGTSGKEPILKYGQKTGSNSQQPLFGANTNSIIDAFTKSTSVEQEKEAISFSFKPQTSPETDTDKAKPNKSVFAAQPAAPFSFTPTSGSLKFSFGPTQIPSPSSSSTAKSPHAFPTLFGELSAPKSSDKTSSNSPLQGFSFGSPSTNRSAKQPQDKPEDKPLTFSASPNAGFGLDEDDEDKPVESSDQPSPSTLKETKATPATATTIMPQLFWQQQLEEKFKFGNLHKTQPLAGMAPALAPISGKGDSTFPASFVLSQMAAKSSTESQATPPSGSPSGALELSHLKQPEILMSLLNGKPKVSSPEEQRDLDEYDDYSEDDNYETESEYTESYASSEEDYEGDERKLHGEQESSFHEQEMYCDSKSSTAGTQACGGIGGRKVLTARSALKKDQATVEECVFVCKVEASKSDQDKAARLMLPPNFFNYSSLKPCEGCLGCSETKRSALVKEKEQQILHVRGPKTEEKKTECKQSPSIFGTPGKNVLSFSSFTSGTSWATANKESLHRAFPMAGQQLFLSAENEDTDPSEEADIHFKPLIALPELVDSKSGEDEYTVLFSERAKLYRFDVSLSMWKERGTGDIKLLLDENTGRGRVVMRRDQVHKLCANHWITKDMELLSNSTSERSWVWQTLSDLSEEVPSQEKLAVRFKSPESAKKFKEVFEELVVKAQDLPTSNEVKKRTQIPLVEKKLDTWNCDACYCPNSTQDTNCIACGAENPERKTFDGNLALKEVRNVDISKTETMPSPTSMAAVTAKPVFTIGRDSEPEEDLETIEYKSSPSKSSPSKSAVNSSSNQPVVSSSTQHEPFFGSGLGSMATGKFNFRLELKPDCAKPKSVVKSPVKSPQSPHSPGSPGLHPEMEDDGIHFEPVISLPKLVSKTTGEENEETLFCHRAKVYRFDAKENQWKERGVGEVKILSSKKSGKSRILMRRDNVLKICVNHQIMPEMELNPKTEKSWVWNTPADFADEIPKPETLAIRFKTPEVAMEFKDAFVKGRQCKKTDQPPTAKDVEQQKVDDVAKDNLSQNQVDNAETTEASSANET